MFFINGQAGHKTTGPNSIEALGVFVFSMVYLIYGGPIITACFGKNAVVLLTFGLGLLPLLYSILTHNDFKSVFLIRKVQIKYILGGFFLCMGMFVFTFCFSTFVGYLYPEAQKVDSQFISYVRKENIFLVIFAVSILPAICEELLYRGYILSGLHTVENDTASIVLCGMMFGLMHFDPYKIPFTVLIGIGLSYAAKKSGSIFIPIFMHGLHNLLLLVLTRHYFLVFTHDFSGMYDKLREMTREIWKNEQQYSIFLFIILAFLTIFVLTISFLLIYIGVSFFKKKKRIYNEYSI